MDQAPAAYESLIADHADDLRARHRSEKTIKAYGESARLLGRYLADQGRPPDPTTVTKPDVQKFITYQLETWTASTAATRFRCLQQFFTWLESESIIDKSPMARMTPPKVGDAPVPVFTTDELRSLIKACAGTTFADRRDLAIVRLFIATGVRLGEMSTLRLDQVDKSTKRLLVHGKGDRARWVPYSTKSAPALNAYLRERARHRTATTDWLWLGVRGRLTASGISQILEKRADLAGVTGMHAHRFRHDFSHRALANGMNEGDLQQLAGWRSPQMLQRYGASARAERAHDAYQRIDLEADL